MDPNSKKRERSINFSIAEVAQLISLVIEKKNIIENKESNAVSWKEKEEAWEAITHKFNANSGVNPRCAKVLRLKYDNIKRNLKKKRSDEKKELYITGGGPPLPVNFTEPEEQLYSIIYTQIDGLESKGDCDSLFIDTDHELITNVGLIDPEAEGATQFTEYSNNATDLTSTTSTINTKSWNLKDKKSNSLCIKKLETTEKISSLAEKKMALIGIQMDLAKTESQIKEYELKRADALLKEAEVRLKEAERESERKEEEHKLRLKMLEVELRRKLN